MLSPFLKFGYLKYNIAIALIAALANSNFSDSEHVVACCAAIGLLAASHESSRPQWWQRPLNVAVVIMIPRMVSGHRAARFALLRAVLTRYA